MLAWIKNRLSRHKKTRLAVPGLLLEQMEERILLAASPLIDKDVTATSSAGTSGTDVTIGEVITYDLTVTIEEGVTNNIVVTDDIPDNIEFVAGSLTVTPHPSPAGHISTTYNDEATSATYDGDVLTVDLGTVVNLFDGNPNNNTITITYNAVVQNDAGNQDGVAKPNTASVTDGFTTDTATANVDIVEPDLNITLEVTASTTDLKAGDEVQYQIQLSHTSSSTSDAHDIYVSDILPAELQGGQIVSATINGGSQPAIDVSSALDIQNGQLITTGDIDLELNGGAGSSQYLTIVMSADVSRDISSSVIISTSASATWTSLDGAGGAERHGGGGVNDYTTAAPASITADPFDDSPPPVITETPITSHPSSPLFAYDIVRNQAEPEDTFRLDFQETELTYILPPLPVNPLYSGSAPPGSSLTVTLLDDHGDVLGSQSVIADAGGNWLTVFSAVYLEDYPYTIEVHHEAASALAPTSSDIAPLLYYSPATNIITVFKNTINEEYVFLESAEQSIDLLHSANIRPLSVL